MLPLIIRDDEILSVANHPVVRRVEAKTVGRVLNIVTRFTN